MLLCFYLLNYIILPSNCQGQFSIYLRRCGQARNIRLLMRNNINIRLTYWPQKIERRICAQLSNRRAHFIYMSKQGMKRPEITDIPPKKRAPEVPEIQGKAKHGKTHANPIIAGSQPPSQKVYHTRPFSESDADKPISDAYSTIDNDLARDNLENDIPLADLQDL